MDNGIYAALTRQSGLMREMRSIANNIANANTTGFRREGVIFSEYLTPTNQDRRDGLSMGHANGRLVDLSQAGMTMTGGTYDMAIDGPGFFAVATAQGNMLTRAGAFMTSADGEIINADGHRLLDDGLAPITVPAGATAVAIGPDGTISADGAPVGRVGLFAEPAAEKLRHQGGTLFRPETPPEPTEQSRIQQGFLESSNVDSIQEISRMIEVQRAYELGQSFLEREDQRIRSVIKALAR